MKTFGIIASLAAGVLLFSCGPSQRNYEEQAPAAVPDSSSSAYVSSSAATENGKDSTRKFIRTAEMKFKVKNVIKSTYNIEGITARNGGFVTYTSLNSTIDQVKTNPVSADSSLETTFYTVTNTITLRVPNTSLDTTLKEIAANIEFLDYRIIKADDVALLMLSNTLAEKRAARAQQRLSKAIDEKGGKIGETTEAENLLLSRQDMADHAKISNLSLADQVNFSTVNLIIYPRQSVKRELISNYKNIKEYEPGFGSRFVESLSTGWKILEAVILFIFNLWAVILLGLALYLLYRYFGRNRNKKELPKA